MSERTSISGKKYGLIRMLLKAKEGELELSRIYSIFEVYSISSTLSGQIYFFILQYPISSRNRSTLWSRL